MLALLDVALAAWWIGGNDSPFDTGREPRRLSAQVAPQRIRVAAAPVPPATAPSLPPTQPAGAAP